MIYLYRKRLQSESFKSEYDFATIIAKRAEEMDEKDAHGYDLEMMKIWYKGKEKWDWKTLPDLKKIYLEGLMLEEPNIDDLGI
jgi:hypothetical protein